MTYRDRTFCCHSESCVNEKCYLKLDLMEYREDCRRAKFEYPISHADFKTSECGYISRVKKDGKL